MKSKSVGIGLLALTCLLSYDVARAQGTSDPWYARQPKPKNIDPPISFKGTFSIELPKDWQLAPGQTNTILSSVERKGKNQTGGAITLEYQALRAPLGPALMVEAIRLELEDVKSRELSGKDFASEVKNAPFGPFMFIHYRRPGLLGADDHVVRYSIPVGTTLYRIICVAPSATMAKYQPVFAYVAASFMPLRLSGK